MSYREKARAACEAEGHHKLKGDGDAEHLWSCVRCGHVEPRVNEVKRLLGEWWEDERCSCPSPDWCSLGGVDKRLGRALAVLGLVDETDAR